MSDTKTLPMKLDPKLLIALKIGHRKFELD